MQSPASGRGACHDCRLPSIVRTCRCRPRELPNSNRFVDHGSGEWPDRVQQGYLLAGAKGFCRGAVPAKQVQILQKYTVGTPVPEWDLALAKKMEQGAALEHQMATPAVRARCLWNRDTRHEGVGQAVQLLTGNQGGLGGLHSLAEGPQDGPTVTTARDTLWGGCCGGRHQCRPAC